MSGSGIYTELFMRVERLLNLVLDDPRDGLEYHGDDIVLREDLTCPYGVDILEDRVSLCHDEESDHGGQIEARIELQTFDDEGDREHRRE